MFPFRISMRESTRKRDPKKKKRVSHQIDFWQEMSLIESQVGYVALRENIAESTLDVCVRFTSQSISRLDSRRTFESHDGILESHNR